MAITINHQTNDISATSGSMTIDGSAVGVDNTKMPLAGGTFTGDVTFEDSDKAIFGTGSDLQIWHDGSNSYIKDAGTGDLRLQAAHLYIQNTFGQNIIDAHEGGSVNLYHNTSQKLGTSSTGVSITGNATFADNGKAIFGAGSDLQIFHDGSNSYIQEGGTGQLVIRSEDLRLQDASGTNWLQADTDGAVRLYHNNSNKLATTSAGVDVTGNATFADNGKAIFGAGSDLQIYHDGSHSYLYETGTGEFRIKTNGNIIQFLDNSNNYLIKATVGAEVGLYFNTAQKLATTNTGIDVASTIKLTNTANSANYSTISDGGGLVINSQNNNPMYFYTGGSEAMRIDSSGNLLVGKTSSSSAVHGGEIRSTGQVVAAVDGSWAGLFNRETSDGEILRFKKDDATAGSINCVSTNLAVSSAGQLRFNAYGAERMRLETNGDLHVDGNVIAYSTTISDERLKEDIKPITGALDKVGQLSGYTFTYKADGKQSAGVIAQEVEAVLPSAVTESTLPLKTDDDVEYKTVQYDQLHGLLIEAIKELKAEIEELKNGSAK